MRKSIFIFFLLFLINDCAFCDSNYTDDSQKFQEILRRIYKLPKHVKNRVTLEYSYGLSSLSVLKSKYGEELSNAYQSSFNYGFTRIDTVTFAYNLAKYAHDFAFLENISSKMKPFSWKYNGKTTDTWRFGFGFSNAWGWSLDVNRYLFLYHSATLSWSNINFEQGTSVPNYQEYLKNFENHFKFGTSFGTGIKANITNILYFDLGYEHLLVHPEFNFVPWFGTAMIELLFQRSIDYLFEDIFYRLGNSYPLYNFVLKNAMSIAFNELRRRNSFAPFESKSPVNFDSIRLGVSLVF